MSSYRKILFTLCIRESNSIVWKSFVRHELVFISIIPEGLLRATLTSLHENMCKIHCSTTNFPIGFNSLMRPAIFTYEES